MEDLFVTFFTQIKSHKSVPLKFDCQPATCFPGGWCFGDDKNPQNCQFLKLYTLFQETICFCYLFIKEFKCTCGSRGTRIYDWKIPNTQFFQNYANAKHKFRKPNKKRMVHTSIRTITAFNFKPLLSLRIKIQAEQINLKQFF